MRQDGVILLKDEEPIDVTHPLASPCRRHRSFPALDSGVRPTHAPSDVQQEGDQKFPMAAAEFRQHVTDRVAKARVKMEEHIASKQLPQDKADAHRARFQIAVDQITAKVDEVCADGTVTKEEALAVRELARSLLHHHHNGAT